MSKYIVTHGIRIAKDFVPETFGRLTTIGPRFMLPYGTQGRYQAYCVYQCSCSSVCALVAANVGNGNTKSCGCVRVETTVKRSLKHGCAKKTSEYATWASMRARCNNPNNPAYPDYGKRGISVCPEWDNANDGFQNFIAFMGPKPGIDYEIERGNVNGNYCPENCKWATITEQNRNKRNNRWMTYKEKTQCLAAWAEELGISPDTLNSRVSRGWSDHRALSTPVKHTKPK